MTERKDNSYPEYISIPLGQTASLWWKVSHVVNLPPGTSLWLYIVGSLLGFAIGSA